MRGFSDAVREMKEMSFLIGESAENKLICADIDKYPHLFISGVTGCGKSVFLNSLLLSLMLRNRNTAIRFVLYDSKAVELSCYNGGSHLLLPVITGGKMIQRALSGATYESKKRIDTLLLNGKKSLTELNKYFSEHNMLEQTLPHLIFVIDDLTTIVSNDPEVAETIKTLILKGRTVGIHLILVVQNSSQREVKQISELIPSKLVFLTATEKESRFLIGDASACRLPLNGSAVFSIARGNSIPVSTIMASGHEMDVILSVSQKLFSKYDGELLLS